MISTLKKLAPYKPSQRLLRQIAKSRNFAKSRNWGTAGPNQVAGEPQNNPPSQREGPGEGESPKKKEKTMDYESTFKQINQTIQAAEEHLAKIRQAMALIEAAGKYPVVPWEKWKDDRYLYLKFPDNVQDLNSLKLDKKNRLYFGSKAENIAEARRLVRNSEQYVRLRDPARQLNLWLGETDRAITNLTRRIESWPQLDANLWDQLELEETIDAQNDR